METLLQIEGVGFPAFSARGCQQDLSLIQEPELFKRTINGELLFLGEEGHGKYTSTITCQDKGIPAISHLSRGAVVKVSCIQTLTQPLVEGKATLTRPSVPGSLLCFDGSGKKEAFHVTEELLTPESASEGFIRFRPILTMRILHFRFKTDEWGAKVGWALELEEV